MKVFIVRREDGLGGAEGAARRITHFLSEHFEVVRIKAGTNGEGWDFGGTNGPGWFRSLEFAKKTNRFLKNVKEKHVVLSLERGVLCDIYRAGDGVHRRFMNIKYKNNIIKKWTKPINWIAPSLEKFTVQSCKVVVANSQMVKKDLVLAYPKLSDQIQVVYNGVDSKRYCLDLALQSHAHLREEKLFIFVGHDWKRKGLLECLEICSKYKMDYRKNFKLLVLGKGDPSLFTSKINQIGLDGYVEFLGSVENIEKYYKKADVLIFPTLYDPFSNACLEALACGCAVVTTECNGAAEIVQNGKTGYILPRQNNENKDLLTFLDSSFDRETISHSVRSLVVDAEIQLIKETILKLARA